MVGGLTACMMPDNNCQGGIVIRPCCVGSTGQCVLTTFSNCSFHNGIWHSDKVPSYYRVLCTTYLQRQGQIGLYYIFAQVCLYKANELKLENL